MAVMNQPCPLLSLFLVFFISTIPFSSCQTYSPQNIETFFPFPIETPSPSPAAPTNFNKSPNSTLFPTSPVLAPRKKPSSNRSNIAKAVAATAASTFVAATLLFFFIQRFVIARRKTKVGGTTTTDHSRGGGPMVLNGQFDGNLKGLIVEENGLDELYGRKLGGGNKNNSLHKKVFHGPEGEEEEENEEGMLQTRAGCRNYRPIQEFPLLPGKSSTSHHKVEPEIRTSDRITAPSSNNTQSAGAGIAIKAIGKQDSTSQPSNHHRPPPPPPPPPQPPPPSPPSKAIPIKQGPSLPPPPSMAIPSKQGPAPPPPPPIPAKKNQKPPPPPPIPAKKNQKPPPPPPLPPKEAGLSTSSEPPPERKGMQSDSEPGESSTGNGQVKLKPLHWDKVNKNADHSMVWDKIDGGSFR